MSEFVYLNYTSLRDDMYKHIDNPNGIIEQVGAMETSLHVSFDIGVLFPSVDALKLNCTTFAIKTMADKDVNWEDVSARHIDESKRIKHGSKHRLNEATQCCAKYDTIIDNLKSKNEDSHSRKPSKDEESEEKTELKTKKKK